MITTIVFTKDRPAQLDLLLRSIDRNGGGHFSPILVNDKESGKAFEQQTWSYLDGAGEHVCFMCDDGILYRNDTETVNGKHPGENVLRVRTVLCFSLRLGRNTTTCYPSGLTQTVPRNLRWRWFNEPVAPGVSDFGYPGSLDGHVFRTEDVCQMLETRRFTNPTELEVSLFERCFDVAQQRPLMVCYPQSVYVGNPVNRVSEQSNVRYGTRFPVTAEECRRRFDAGERIDLDALDFSGVNGAHTEIELKWKPSP